MPKKSSERSKRIPKHSARYFRDVPIIPGRPLIEGSDRLQFPAFYRVEEKPVTFRESYGGRSRAEREAYVHRLLEMARKYEGRVIVMIPHSIYSSRETVLFHAGWTLFEADGEILTHQCVVFLAGEAVPIGRSDQGVICAALPESLSAWDGRTSEQSRQVAA